MEPRRTRIPIHLLAALGLLGATLACAERPRISEDRDLIDVDLAGWDCLNRLAGSARVPDGIERNRLKNRSVVDLSGTRLEAMDSAAFLQHVAGFDAQTKGRRRTELNPAQKQQLDSLEKQVVSLTGWLGLAYPGPPETTNCASTDFHDWHLELSAQPADHPPRIGDPTPIICEITPRTQRAIYRNNIRLQALAGFFRRPDLTYEPTGHEPRQIRVTGYLLWDDEHNGAADIGPKIQHGGANKFHRPWRSTAWEIHPVMKIEPLDGLPISIPANLSTPPPPLAEPPVVATPPLAPPAPSPQQLVTLTQPVKIKIPYGETVLPRGMKLPIVSRNAQSVVVKYMDATPAIPIASTDLR
ncbi:MAG TPA: hypothetical protein VIL63_12425 [Terriglobales bacterium]